MAGKKTAGALDVRSIIGMLLTAYGVILTLMGLFADPAKEKTGGVNANLWTGLVLLVVGLGFLVWARVRPLVVPDHVDKDEVTAPER
jgi:multisubunit Na+/H+ antiporter MnhB subunit